MGNYYSAYRTMIPPNFDMDDVSRSQCSPTSTYHDRWSRYLMAKETGQPPAKSSIEATNIRLENVKSLENRGRVGGEQTEGRNPGYLPSSIHKGFDGRCEAAAFARTCFWVLNLRASISLSGLEVFGRILGSGFGSFQLILTRKVAVGVTT